MRTDIVLVGDKELARSLREIGKQAPYALSLTLNRLANVAQQDVQNSLSTRFQLRRAQFVRNTIYRKPGEDTATKTRLEAGVRVDDRRDFLAKHETGGQKTSVDGGRVAVPIGARRNKAEIITKANRPRAILNKKGFRIKDDLIVQTVGRGKRAALKVWYKLVRSVPIRPRLEMAKTSQRAVDREWVRIASEAIEQAMRTAK
jgi:hypothetical protein